MKIGIVTFFGTNFGAILQCYALQKLLTSLGYDVKVINRGWGKEFAKLPTLKQKVKNILFPNRFENFQKKYIRFTSLVTNNKELIDLNDKFDVIIVGSDQVWNSDCIEEMGFYYYLDWVKSNIKKYAYAVSFGKDTFDTTDYNVSYINSILKTYCKISVRERSGIKICNDIFNIDAVCLLDPTLLLTKCDYEKFLPKRKTKFKYICKYILDDECEKNQLIDGISQNLNLRVIDNYPSNINRYKAWFSKKYRYPSVIEWLQNIHNAEYVITDSYHGTIFSIIFNKKFISINNKKRGSTRFQNLLETLGISYKLIDINVEDSSFKFIDLLQSPIDYDLINNKLNELRIESIDYLKNL